MINHLPVEMVSSITISLGEVETHLQLNLFTLGLSCLAFHVITKAQKVSLKTHLKSFARVF